MPGFHELFLTVLLQLAAIVAAARLGAWAFRRAGQPEVVGEILVGVLLGPSLLGKLAPSWMQLVPAPEAEFCFRALSELGLVLFMFLIGLEFDFTHLRHVGRTASRVAVAGIVTPFALGAATALAIHGSVAADTPRLGFTMFVATALSITAIPILGRIMIELKIHRSRLGALTITAAAVDDVLGWILLAGVSALVRDGFQAWPLVESLGLLIVFCAATFFVARPLCLRLVHFAAGAPETSSAGAPRARQLDLAATAILLVFVLLSAAATSAIGVFAIFGPFVLGAALSRERPLAEAVTRQWRTLVYALLLPVFFTSTGLRTDVGRLDSPWLWGVCLLVIAAATAGKMLGCGLAAWTGGCTVRESSCVAVMMNTRALMGLVAINVGRELGVVPDAVFTMLVLMALVTTVITTPILRRLIAGMPGLETEQPEHNLDTLAAPEGR
ncbi:MAG: cation:proton antiporter [Pirellulales bacterium]|nr:cation:proton antiporter [Pirellulales bacterium]